MLYSNPIDILVSSANERDMPVIEQLAKSFDLDCEKLSWKQFVAAKKNDTIIGFGRLREYPGCTEVSTVGVVLEERNKGVGTAIVKELIRMGHSEIFVTCVIPDFFRRFGFFAVQHYPSVLQKKVDFCKLYGFNDERIFVMKHLKAGNGDAGSR